MKCVIIGKLVSCLLASAPAPNSVEAAQILTKSIPPYVYVAPPDLDGPKVYFLGGSADDGPFGSFGSYPVQRPLNCCGVYVHRGLGLGRGIYGGIYSGSSVVVTPPLGTVRGIRK